VGRVSCWWLATTRMCFARPLRLRPLASPSLPLVPDNAPSPYYCGLKSLPLDYPHSRSRRAIGHPGRCLRAGLSAQVCWTPLLTGDPAAGHGHANWFVFRPPPRSQALPPVASEWPHAVDALALPLADATRARPRPMAARFAHPAVDRRPSASLPLSLSISADRALLPPPRLVLLLRV